ncbi:hypothetical protein Hanom_Chr16g01516751 [Helianthus anomalus]
MSAIETYFFVANKSAVIPYEQMLLFLLGDMMKNEIGTVGLPGFANRSESNQRFHRKLVDD